MRKFFVAALAVVVAWPLLSRAQGSIDTEEPLLGQAISTLFNPQAAPTDKTMGLLQRSFLDLVEESRPQLEIALVIDGTESMGRQLEGIRQSLATMMNDLELYKDRDIRYQLVVFRDSGSPSGSVSFPLGADNREFITDRKKIASAIESIQLESGAPYFPEAIDDGLHAAITRFAWSTGDDVSRWIFLFGDAPPFDESFEETENRAKRRYATAALVSLAAENNIHISCILCASRPEDAEAYKLALDRTRGFMNTVSSKTAGLMLDLSYEDIRQAVRAAAPKREVEYQKVGTIFQQDIEAAQQQAIDEGLAFAEGQGVQMAVLPLLPLKEMSFDPSHQAVQLATELRYRLRSIPGSEMKDPMTVKDRFFYLRRQGLDGATLIQMLARALNVDYVVAGSLRQQSGALIADTAIYARTDGQPIVAAQAATNSTISAEQLGQILAEKLVRTNVASTGDRRLRAAFASFARNNQAQRRLVIEVAEGAAKPPLMAGLEALEQALALPVGDGEAGPLLDTARENLERACEVEAKNPLAHYYLSNCLYNQARALQQTNDTEGARRLAQAFVKELRDAFANRNRLSDDPASQLEIEADYALIVRRNTPDAIKAYERLLEENKGVDPKASRRAYWMLAGIYSGDWGVDTEFVDQDKAKKSLVQILALWPDSSEATFIKRVLRWSDIDQRTEFEHFPRTGQVEGMGDGET